jgi:peptide/nickel transport system ATP-binding protein
MHALNPVFTIGVLIDDVLKAHEPGMSRAARRARAEELLELVGIGADRRRSYPHELSGGMRQRVMIALAIALNPQLLIMDEPTTALDVVIQREILEQLMDLRERFGFTVVFITHDLSLLIELADTIAVMYAGTIVEKAPARELFRAPRHPYTRGLLTSFPSLHGPRVTMTGIKGSPPDLRHTPSGCPFHPRCANALPECSAAPPPRITEGQREVRCVLHDGHHEVPLELGVRA